MSSKIFDKRSRKSSVALKRSSSVIQQIDTESQCSNCNLIIQEPRINYCEEVTLIFYDSMFNTIVNEYEAKVINEMPKAIEGSNDEVVEIKEFKNLSHEDLTTSYVSGVEGSRVSLSKLSSVKNLSRPSKDLSKIGRKRSSLSSGVTPNKSDQGKRRLSDRSSTRRSKSSSISGVASKVKSITSNKEINVTENSSGLKALQNPEEWFIDAPDEDAIVRFENGNIYEGHMNKLVMNGNGNFTWADGTYYEGQFKDGYPTGKGMMILPDLSYYKGEFYKSIFHGEGVFCITGTPMIYSGYWKGGKKHGNGWLLYGPGDWYDGEWYEDKRHGMGLRQYKSGARYKGMWQNGLPHGQGSMLYQNNDFYKGEWCKGKPHGYGEYTWRAFANETFTFPLENSYQGNWLNGMRHGIGIIHFGVYGGAKMAGIFNKNIKNGAGVLVCGNGKLVEGNPLFLHDKPVHLNSISSLKKLPESSEDSAPQISTAKKSSVQMLAKQMSQSSKRLEPSPLKTMSHLHGDAITLCNPIDIPIHSVPEQVNLDFPIFKVIKKYGLNETSHCDTIEFDEQSQTSGSNKTPNTSNWNILTLASLPSAYVTKNACADNVTQDVMESTDPADMMELNYSNYSLYQFEEKQLRHLIIIHLPKLREVFDRYAEIASPVNVGFKAIMIRMFLWQLWRDIGILKEGFSLIELDSILDESPISGFETEHYPFEKIYFWQFLQALIAVSWALHLKNGEKVESREGILASLLANFLNKYILPPITHSSSWSLFEFRDLLPIQNVYLLYRSLGEPHTARVFLNATCVKKGSHVLCSLKLQQTKSFKKQRGINTVYIGQNIMYIPTAEELAPELEELKRDPFYMDLITFRKLGAKKIVQCLAEVCPLIMQDGLIVNLEYPLSFLEFYDVLLLCAHALVKKRRRKEEVKETAPEIQELEKNESFFQRKGSKRHIRDKKRPKTK